MDFRGSAGLSIALDKYRRRAAYGLDFYRPCIQCRNMELEYVTLLLLRSRALGIEDIMQSGSQTIAITYLVFLLFICGCSADKPEAPTVPAAPVSPVSTTSASNGQSPTTSSNQNYYGAASNYITDTVLLTGADDSAICTAVVGFLKKAGHPKPIGMAILAETDNVNVVGVDTGAKNLLYLTASKYHHADETVYWKVDMVNALTLQIAGMSGQIAEEKENDREEGERQQADYNASQSGGGTN